MSENGEWLKTACILCSENCGIEVKIDEQGRMARIKGDRAHPASKGYLCQKASRLDYYQNHADRLDSPLRRRPDGTFEEIGWDEAIGEVAERLVQLRDRHGGQTLAYMGGGGQGNHLGGIYGNALKRALGTRYHYSSLAQEKTGGFWVNGKLFGRQSCAPGADVENAEFVMFLGTNPWQSHGIPRARKLLLEIQKDANRTMIVVDPWRTETADRADVHLAVRPGRDAFLFSAMLAVIFEEGLEDKEFVEAHTLGVERLKEIFGRVPIDRYCKFAGLDAGTVREITRAYARAEKASIRADLGLEHTLHSTLNDYLGKLLYLVTGHFGREGCNHLRPQFLPLLGHSADAETEGDACLRTQVTGMPEIARLFPPNILPKEIDTDHPGRIRGVFVESMNPIMSGADTRAYTEAFKKLELLVVLDVAMTETAQLAHYVLPASSQFEKWEATFFGSGVPSHVFQLRAPIFEPRGGTLSEPEIHTRLLRAMGETAATSPLLGAVEQVEALGARYASETDNFKMIAAPIFQACQFYTAKYGEAVQRAGHGNGDSNAGAALFEEIVSNRSGVEIGNFRYEQSFDFIRHGDKKIHLAIDRLLEETRALKTEIEEGERERGEYPFMLSAGGRRAYNANTIFRDPDARRDDREGALWIHPEDLERIGVADGASVVIRSRRGEVTARARATDRAQRGVANLPHGYGLSHPGERGRRVRTGAAVNVLTDSEHCDPLAKTPYHKNIRVNIRAA